MHPVVKSHLSPPALAVFVLFTIIYCLAGFTLLKTHTHDIDFTKKELIGLKKLEVIYAPFFNTPGNNTHLKAQLRDIGNQSNLILDPELISYYASTLLIEHIPTYLEKNSNLADLNYAVGIIAQSNCAHCPDLMQSTAKINAHHNDLKKSDAQLLNKELENLKNINLRILDHLLNSRLSKLNFDLSVKLSIIVFLYLLLISLAYIAVKNIVGKREVIAANEKKLLIKRLAEKNNELEKFAYAAAHDLKEPLRTMRSFATLLGNEAADDLTPASQKYLDIISDTAKRAEEMIKDLLSYSKMSEEKLEQQACNCDQEVQSVIQDLEHSITAIQPEITIKNLPVIKTVPSMFRRVVLNLIDNAIKYRKESEPLRITITATPQTDMWLFQIQDNGIGIEPEETGLVFEPFRRLHPTINLEGKGIGLTSCKKIIERLGGEIWMESAIKKGSTVFFTLPK